MPHTLKFRKETVRVAFNIYTRSVCSLQPICFLDALPESSVLSLRVLMRHPFQYLV